MFQFVCAPDTAYWNSIMNLINGQPTTYVMTQTATNPTGYPNSRWAQAISAHAYPNGVELGFAIATRLVQQDRPAIVMIDELNTSTETLVYDAANFLHTYYPTFAPFWGCMVAMTRGVSLANYDDPHPAIGALLAANAIVTCEMYPKYSDWCGIPAANRDTWLRDFFQGGGTLEFQTLIHE